jgi:hypothetical protein
VALICWIFGHRWFATVQAEARFNTNDIFYVSRGLFHEKLCLRCGKQQADHVETLDTWEPYDGIEALNHIERPPVFGRLPGDGW